MANRIEVTINGEQKVVDGGQSIAGLLASLKINPQHVAVEVNLELVPRESHVEHMLVAGDRVEVVTLVGGG